MKTMSNYLESLKKLLQLPDLASKRWIYEQYDSQVMNDTISSKGDAAIVRVHGSNKAVAITTDCTPRYVAADPFEGAKQAVAETYRNISAVGATPLAITNCLNFGNPQKPEIMGQIVRAIQGITEACKALDYPVVSGNVSLYNETEGSAIQPTPAIGGVGLLKDLTKRCDHKFKIAGDKIFILGKQIGHLGCSLFERELLGVESGSTPPKVDLVEEKKNSICIIELIQKSIVNACHDISDGGLAVALFEMSSHNFGFKLLSDLVNSNEEEINKFLFAEDQSLYVIAIDPSLVSELSKIALKHETIIREIGQVTSAGLVKFFDCEIPMKVLIDANEALYPKKFC